MRENNFNRFLLRVANLLIFVHNGSIQSRVKNGTKKKEARLILQSGTYTFFTNISEGTALLLQGLTYSVGVELRSYNLK